MGCKRICGLFHGSFRKSTPDGRWTHAENWLKELGLVSQQTKKTKTKPKRQENVIKNKQSRDIDISSSEDERRVISFPTLDDPYTNNQNIYESNRQNNPTNEVL